MSQRARRGDCKSPLNYRQALVNDVPAVASLGQAHYGGDLEEWQRRMRKAATRSDGLLVVAESDQAVVGYGKAHFYRPHDSGDQAPRGFYLTRLVVDPPRRVRGVGSELIARRVPCI